MCKGARAYARPSPESPVRVTTWPRSRRARTRRSAIPSFTYPSAPYDPERRRSDPMADENFRITYATLSADNEDLQRNYDEAVERAREELGKEWPFVVNGEERWTEEKYEEPSPIDSDIIVGRFSQASPEDVEDAVEAAKGFSLGWERMGWRERVRILRSVADVMEDRLFDLAALMAFEVGKSRLEALGDVQETAELIRWNCDEVEKHEGFRVPMSGMGAAGEYYDVMRPY